MRRFISYVSVALLFGMTGAQAAPPPVYGWTGFYIGANVGGDWDVGQIQNANLALEPVIFSDPTGAHAGIPAAIFIIPGTFAAPVSYSRSGGGSVMGGGQFGYNYQMGQYVYGLEADVDGMHAVETFTGAFSQSLPGVLPTGNVTRSLTGTINVERDWQASFRGRFGYAWDRWLAYGTGGVSVTSIQTQASFTAVTTLGAALAPVPGFPNPNGTTTNSTNQTLWGLTLGAGVEYAVTNAVRVGAEYRFTHYPNQNLNLGASPAGAVPVTFPPTGSLALDSHQVELRLSYLFGHP